jgi:hypothetical protein
MGRSIIQQAAEKSGRQISQEDCVGVKKTGKGRRKIGRKKSMAIGPEKAQVGCSSAIKHAGRIFAAGCREVFVTTRSRRETLTFKHPFRLEGIDRALPAGAYDVVTDEEMIEGLSFAVFRRVATMITVPCAPPHHASVEMIAIGSLDLANAQRIDDAAT